MVAATTTATRCATAPTYSATGGALVGTGDWRLYVERLNGVGGSIVGACVVGASPTGDAVVGSLEWEDLTRYVRGMEWTRGSDQPCGLPIVGEMSITFHNGSGLFTPWTEYADTRPGTIIRAGLRSATDVRASGWLPLFTGVVDSWVPEFTGRRSGVHSSIDYDSFAESLVTVRLVETVSTLARIDENETSSIGSGDLCSQRLDRLLTAANWKFGVASYTVALAESIPLQATTMSANRLTECYLTAESAAYIFRSDVTGAAIQTDISRYSYQAPSTRLAAFSYNGTSPFPALSFTPRTTGTSSGLRSVVYDSDSLSLVSDPQHIVNDHRYARAGGTQQLVEHTVSVGRFGRSTRARSDLISTADIYALGVAGDHNRLEARTTLRVDGVTVTASGKDEVYLLVAAIDLWNWSYIWTNESAAQYVSGSLRSMTHSVTPLKNRLHWVSTFAFDTQALGNFPDGAILDPVS
jgi:hypothetical protein